MRVRLMTRPQAQLRYRTKPLIAPFSWLLALTLLLFLAACGGDETSRNENAPPRFNGPANNGSTADTDGDARAHGYPRA